MTSKDDQTSQAVALKASHTDAANTKPTSSDTHPTTQSISGQVASVAGEEVLLPEKSVKSQSQFKKRKSTATAAAAAAADSESQIPEHQIDQHLKLDPDMVLSSEDDARQRLRSNNNNNNQAEEEKKSSTEHILQQAQLDGSQGGEGGAFNLHDGNTHSSAVMLEHGHGHGHGHPIPPQQLNQLILFYLLFAVLFSNLQ